jgi:hypothetical protein
VSGTIERYTFEDADGMGPGYSTFDPAEAREYGQQYGLKVIANSYEWADSEVAWDFTSTKRPAMASEIDNTIQAAEDADLPLGLGRD